MFDPSQTARRACRAAALATMGAGIFLGDAAQAQQLAQAGGLEEIVVTARRREENIQAVPIAITAMTAEDIQRRQITDQYRLVNTVPSMIVYNSTQRDAGSFAIRGQASTYGGSAGVLTYFNEVPTAMGAVGSYFDLANIQVLKGPQGTLFGGTSTGGAILFESARPRDGVDGYAQLTLGRYNWREFEGAVNFPLAPEKLLVRLAGSLDLRDGYTKDVGLVPAIQQGIAFTNSGFYKSNAGTDYDNRNDRHGRLSVTFRPTDEIENLIVARYDWRRTHGPGANVVGFNPGAFAPGGLLAGLGFVVPFLQAEIAQQAALGPRLTSYDNPQLDKFRTWQVIDNLHWNLSDAWTLKNIFSYGQTKTLSRWDEDATPFPLLQPSPGKGQTRAVLTEEVQLQGLWLDNALQTTVGGYYEKSNHPKGLFETNGFYPNLNSFFGQAGSLSIKTERQRALFGQATYDLGAAAPVLEGVKLTGGLRHTWSSTRGTGTTLASPYITFGSLFLPPAAVATNLPVTSGNANCFTGAPGCFTPITSSSSKFSSLGWTLQLEDQINQTTFVYVRAGKAFKPGGVNNNAIPSQALFTAEFLQDVEIGLKKDWRFDGAKARTNIAAFRGSYDDMQRSLLGSSANGTPIGLTLNAADGTIQGVEFEGTLALDSGLEFRGTYTFTDTGYDSFKNPQLEAALQGVGFPFTPRHRFSLGGRYHLPMPESTGDFSIGTSFAWQAQFSVGLTNITSSFPYLPAYGVLDFDLTWADALGYGIDLSAFVTNALDRLYVTGQQDFYSQLGFYNRTFSEPRMWGFKMKYRW